jgi:hypothetical protein
LSLPNGNVILVIFSKDVTAFNDDKMENINKLIQLKIILNPKLNLTLLTILYY